MDTGDLTEDRANARAQTHLVPAQVGQHDWKQCSGVGLDTGQAVLHRAVAAQHVNLVGKLLQAWQAQQVTQARRDVESAEEMVKRG